MTIDARHPLPGRHPLVVGAARSGLAAARLLARHGLDVRLVDRARPTAGAEALAALGIEAVFGSDDASQLAGRDVVIWSPGIPLGHPIADAARARGIPVLSELELGWLAARAPFLCITGTNGKSTTTDLTGALLRAAGREVAVCGNIGRAVCEVAETIGPSGLLVVEVSSFQLETVERLQPFVATWLNLTPDHLDRHGSLEEYARLKQRLFARQTESDWAVWNADDPQVMAHRAGAAQPLTFSHAGAVEEGACARDGAIQLAWRGGTERLIEADALKIPGPHNLDNALAALATVLPLEPPPDALRRVLAEYRGLEHRLEPVARIDGVAFVNDSKATNVPSLAVALVSFPPGIVLIAGGRDKQQDFTPVRDQVKARCQHVVLIGEGADRIAAAWRGVPMSRAGTLGEAVDAAFDVARRAGGGVVLLSPACASFDMFQDYEHRGRAFKDEVARLQGNTSPQGREAHA
ncbi:MAG TPA: UDP-N-acetylmuramoyl-L-alanine--D-glutamate ligase [Candidatus Eisenbacteria bacterium]|nr:UDP-N-acetylmuramoyl-L-alanine--D-glutamate ligase [Candidatus Eisenbacteria bacterium]